MRNSNRKAVKRFIASLLCALVLLEQAGIPFYAQAAETGSEFAAATGVIEETRIPEVTEAPQTTDLPVASDILITEPPAVTAAPEVTDTPEITDITDISDITDTTEITDPPAVTDTTDDTTAEADPSDGDEADLMADVESEADWLSAAGSLGLTGERRHDVLLMAESQLGYNESVSNYIADESGTMHGYTRYGQWCGNPYGDWNAAFVGFCLHYAGIEEIPFAPDCRQWIEQLKLNDGASGTDLYRESGEYQPAAGDIVFFNTMDETGLLVLTRAGIITSVTEDGFVTIEGDNGPVRYCEYSSNAIDANSVLGYIVVSGNSDNEIQYVEQTICDENNAVSISGSLPEGAQVIARKLDESETEALGFAAGRVAFAYDIDIFVNDEKCELVSPVSVKILSVNNPDGKPVTVSHAVTDDMGNISWETVESGIDESGAIVFTAEAFSVYVGELPYLWADLDDEAFAAWVTSGENDEQILTMAKDNLKEYEAFNQRLEQMESDEYYAQAVEYLMALIDGDLADMLENIDSSIVYVGDSYAPPNLESVTNLGRIPSRAVPTLQEAYAKLPDTGGTIYVVGKVRASELPVNSNKPVVIVGYEGSFINEKANDNSKVTINQSTIYVDGDWVLKGDIEFYDIDIVQGSAGNKTIYPEGHSLQIGRTDEESGDTKTFIKNSDGAKSDWLIIYTDPYDSRGGVIAANDGITKVDIAIHGAHKDVRFGGLPLPTNGKYDMVLLPNLETIRIYVAGSNTEKNTIYSGGWYVSLLPAFGKKLADVQVTLKNIDFGGYHPHLNRGWWDARPESNANFTYNFDNVNTSGIDASNKSGNWMCIGPFNTKGNFTFNLKNSNINKLYIEDGNVSDKYSNVNNLTLNFENSTIAELHTDYHEGYETLHVNGAFELTLKDSKIADKCLLANSSSLAAAAAKVNIIGNSSLPLAFEYRNTTARTSPVKISYSENIVTTIPTLQAERYDITVGEGCTVTFDKEQNQIHNVNNNGTIIATVNQNWSGDYTGNDGAKIELGALSKVHVSGNVSGTTAVSLQDSTADKIIAGISAGGNGPVGAITLTSYDGVTASAAEGSWRYIKGVEEHNQPNCVYLSYRGNDNNNGTSSIDAVFSISKAYELAAPTGKRIVLCDEYLHGNVDDNGQWAFGDSSVTHPNEPVLFTNTDGVHTFTEAKLIVPTAYNFVGDNRAGHENDAVNEVKYSTGIRMEGSFRFENIIFSCSEGDDYGKAYKYLNIFANGYKTIIGDGCNTDGIRRNIIYGGAYNSNTIGSTDLTVQSGKFYRIYGGNRTGVVQNGIKLSVVPSVGQSVTGVNLIDGGSTDGTIDVEVSGDVQFDDTRIDPPKGDPVLKIPVKINGGRSSATATATAALKIHDISQKIDYIYGPNSNNSTITIDNVTAGTVYMHSCSNPHYGSGEAKIGYNGLVTADYIYAADNSECGSSGRYNIYLKEAKAKSVTGYSKIDNFYVVGNSEVESEISGVKAVQVNSDGKLTYHGTDLKAEDVSVNGGTLNLASFSARLPSLKAEVDAKLILAEGGNLNIAGAVSGVTTVESERFTITAPTAAVESTPQSGAFVADGIVYSASGDNSIWKKEKVYEGILDVVYVSGSAGDDANSGESKDKAVKTLGKAFEIVKNDGYIVVCGDTTFDAWPSIPKKVFITSNDSLVPGVSGGQDYRSSGAKLSFTPGSASSYMTMLADLTLRHLNIEYAFDTEYGGIDANGHCLTIGEKRTETYSDNRPSDVTFIKKDSASNNKLFIIGGGRSINYLDSVNLKLYNTSVYGVSAIWGGNAPESSVTVAGDVNLDLQDCSYTQLLMAGLPDQPDSKLGYAAIYGNSYVTVEITDSNAVNRVVGSSTNNGLSHPRGYTNLKNNQNATLNMINHSNRKNAFTWDDWYLVSPARNFDLPHAKGKNRRLYDGGKYGVKCDNLIVAGQSMEPSYEEGDSPEIVCELRGNISIRWSELVWNYGAAPATSVTLILGDEVNGSGGIDMQPTNNPKHQVFGYQESNTGKYSETNAFKDFTVEVYPGTNARFRFDPTGYEIKTQNPYYNNLPVVILHSKAGEKSVYTVDESADLTAYAQGVYLMLDNVVLKKKSTSGTKFDLHLKNESEFISLDDENTAFKLDGQLTIEGAGAKLTVPTVATVKSAKLLNAQYTIEQSLTVEEKLTSTNSTLTMGPYSVLTVGEADGNTTVNYSGTNQDGRRFSITEKQPHAQENHFVKGRDANGNEFDLIYDCSATDTTVWSYGAQNDANVIFISKLGSDSNDGSEPYKAVETLQKAFDLASQRIEWLKTEKPDEKAVVQIVFSGAYDLTNEDKNQVSDDAKKQLGIIGEENYEIILSQWESAKGKVTVAKDYAIPYDLTIKNIKLTYPYAHSTIFANGHTVVFDEGVKNILEDGTSAEPALYGGSKAGEVANTNLTVYSGNWFRIYGGGQDGTVSGDTNITLGDASRKLAPQVINESDKADKGSFMLSDTNAVFGGGENGNVGGNTGIYLNYGEDYGWIFGAGQNKESVVTGNTNITMGYATSDSPVETKVLRIYGGSYRGSVTGTTNINMLNGEALRVYGGGQDEGTTVGNTNVVIGSENGTATVKSYLRGSGDQGGVGSLAKLKLQNGAVIPDTCQVAAGGYAGTTNNTELDITGGIINTNVYAGGWGEGIPGAYGNISQSTTLNISGGTINGDVYGGGNRGLVHAGDGNAASTVKVTGGTISGNVYGGGNAAGVDKSNVTVTAPANIVQNVYGGSYNITEPEGDIQKASEVILNDAAITGGCVFGGSNLSGDIKENTKVTVPVNITANATVYGGGNQAKITGKANVVIDGALTGNVFGGGKGAVTNGTLSDANAKETSVTVNGTITGSIYGGGELATVGDESATVEVVVTNVTLNTNAIVIGNVYGGGKGEANADYAKINGNTVVKLLGGTVKTTDNSEDASNGNIFGGGEIAPVAGNTQVNVTSGEYSNIFGGNDVSGEIGGTAKVTVLENSSATVAHIYGGGRNAACKNATVNVEANSNATITDVYGGGYGRTAVTTNTTVSIGGSKITTAYGGGNAATVTDSVKITVNSADNQQCVDTVFAGNNKAEMTIHPTLVLEDGKIGTLYGGGNQGAMNVPGGLVYDLNAPNIEIGTVYGGCKAADVPERVQLTLTAGAYGTVYGGNNESGLMPSTVVTLAGATVGTTVSDADGTRKTFGGLYGGGNMAETGRTKIILKSGKASNVYGGGNKATVTDSVTIETAIDGIANVTNLFCGNNQADMSIRPNIDKLQSGTVWTFYGGGNAGAMTNPDGLTYTFDKPDMHYTYIIGGCNAADVTSEKGVTLQLNNVTADTAIYGGCNEKGNVEKTTINIIGNVCPQSDPDNPDSSAFTSVFGGGRGEQTTVGVSNVNAQNGTVKGSVYGGSGFGRVTESHVKVQERDKEAATDKIVITGSVFGAGYGESSVVGSTDILIDTDLRIQDPNTPDGGEYDLKVTETLASTTTNEGDTQSGETSVTVNWLNNSKENISYIGGNVYGGGDMGQVGRGVIHPGSNTANVFEDGYTHVKLVNGYVEGDIFGGGSGKPASGMNYSLYMGTVFGCCQTDVIGGYVKGNVYGGGYQSRVYANPASTRLLPLYFDAAKSDRIPAENALHNNVLAAQVNIIEQSNYKPIIIGSSVFGGGAKGESASTNPTVYTVVGDVEVNVIGQHDVSDKTRSTAIYFDQDNKSGGGIYGDGNLCLVNGDRAVNIRCFNAGYMSAAEGSEAAGKVNMLKTFYSLQRADTVNVYHSKFVLRGAEDLVDENADRTLFSINRVEQLNMYQNSTIKLMNIVNYLGGLWSDEHATTRYLNRGNNGANKYTKRNGVGIDYSYPDSGTESPNVTDITQNGRYENSDGSIRRMLGNNNRIIHYRNEYMRYLYGAGAHQEKYNQGEKSDTFATLTSFNEICVANGKYLEIKKSDTEYGDVKGVFILSLLHANPGTGGGFVYASIGDADELNSGSTGAFVCVTKDTSQMGTGNKPLPSEQQPYMIISHNVGGYRTQPDNTKDYSYYYWYIKGNKYVYDMDVVGYIGTATTDFDTTAVLTEMEERHYILKKIEGEAPLDILDSPDHFCSGRLVDYWNEEWAKGDFYALELKVVSHDGGTGDPVEESIGFLHYDAVNKKWGIKKADNNVVYGKGENTDPESHFKPNDLIAVASQTTNLELMVVLHKGSEVQTEIRKVPVKLDFDVYSMKDGNYNTSENASEIQFNLYTSIIRLVPTQDVYLGAGRIYSGVPTDMPIRITGDSAFTVQYITKFMPSAFNTSSAHMTESLTAASEEIYLLDKETGVGFTLDNNGNLIHVTEGAMGDYTIAPKTEGGYTVTYKNKKNNDGTAKQNSLVQSGSIPQSVSFPVGTMITMIAQIDNNMPTYWYYYCKGNESTLNLTEFVKMNSTDTDTNGKFDFEKASGGKIPYTASQLVTEKLSFIFDFSKTDLSAKEAQATSDELAGNLRLLHTFTSGNHEIDIMDAVTSRKQVDDEGVETTVFERSHPVISEKFSVAGGKGYQEIEIAKIDSGYQKDTFDVTFTVSGDDALGENTRYGEREYSVLIELVDESGSSMSFPAGTTFTYDGQLLTLGNSNKSVCVPIKSAGEYTVTMQTSMTGFTVGSQKLRATLYSSSDASYYNELDTGRYMVDEFAITANPSFALSVKQAENIHLYSAGESIALTLDTKSEIVGDNAPISVKLFKYNRRVKKYESIALNEILTGAQEAFAATAEAQTWNTAIADNAALGTYRLEFRYHDRTEYWDFIVKKPE